MSGRPPRKQSRVPRTRTGRLVRLGLTAGELLVGGLVEGARRAAGRKPDGIANAFLSTANARRLAKRLAHMRGAAMKLGQLLSMEGEHILPPEFAEALSMLQASADTMPAAQVHRLFGREYGKGWEARFSEFDDEPVASASIGQVHRAVTVDGREVALKIQYPGVAKSINSDVDNLALFLQAARILPVEFDLKGLLKEAKRQLRQEADYLAEAKYLEHYGELVRDEPEFRVPAVHRDLTTTRILAMEYLEGEPLESLGRVGVPQETRDRIGTLLEHLLFRELFEFRVMQTDPNFGNYLVDAYGEHVVLLDFGSTMTLEPGFTSHYARICRAIMDGDDAAVRAAARDIGYLHEKDSPAQTDRVMAMLRLICEPLVHEGPFDFAASDLPMRARDAGIDLIFRSGEFRAPPPATAFLHRKLIGSFYICAKIRARVDVRSLIQPLLEQAA